MIDPILVLRLNENTIQVIRLLQSTPLKSFDLSMVKYGTTNWELMKYNKNSLTYPHILSTIIYDKQGNIVGNGYTTHPSKPLNYFINNLSDTHLFFQFLEGEKWVSQLPTSVTNPVNVLPVEYLQSQHTTRLMNYRESSEFHYKLSLYNLYLNLVLNDQIPIIEFPHKPQPEFLSKDEIIDILTTINPDFAEEFEFLVEQGQGLLRKESIRGLSKEKKGILLSELTNNLLINGKAIDKDLNNYNLQNYAAIKKN